MTPGTFRLGTLLGVPININVSWFLTLFFITSILALKFYPTVMENSSHRDDLLLHWVMGLASGLVFFASVIAHELAHSLVAQRQGVPVRGITLFVFGGVAQITSEARRPLHEFVMAIVGPLTSVALGGLFFVLWWLTTGFSEDKPVAVVLQWLFMINVVVGAFNMAPGFPMDGGRVLRSVIWGVSGNYYRSTHWVTVLGRGMGLVLMGFGALAAFRVFGFIDPWSGLWLFILGLFLESQARASWLQTRALDVLGGFAAGDVMDARPETVEPDTYVRTLSDRPAQRYVCLVAGDDDRVVGVVTEKEVAALTAVAAERRATATMREVMRPSKDMPVAAPDESGGRLLERMEAADLWHMPVVSDGQVVGIVHKEDLLRLLARHLQPSIGGGRPSDR